MSRPFMILQHVGPFLDTQKQCSNVQLAFHLFDRLSLGETLVTGTRLAQAESIHTVMQAAKRCCIAQNAQALHARK